MAFSMILRKPPEQSKWVERERPKHKNADFANNSKSGLRFMDSRLKRTPVSTEIAPSALFPQNVMKRFFIIFPKCAVFLNTFDANKLHFEQKWA